MENTEILRRPLKVLSEDQRRQYFEKGYTVMESLIPASWSQRLQEVTTQFVEQSRDLVESNGQFDLEPGHSSAMPRIRRLISPVDQHPIYWEFACCEIMLDIAEDLLGPDIKFHHGKLNFKSPGGGEEVKWHQDIQFWPHTNYNLLTIGVYLEDVTEGQGEMGFIPESHSMDLFDLYDGDRWVGYIQEGDIDAGRIDTAVFPTGPAGTVTVHNCRTIHGSSPNDSDRPRPLLLQTYVAADAMAYTNLVRKTPHGDELIRGNQAKWARHDPRPCLMPPKVIGTIFQAQQRETETEL